MPSKKLCFYIAQKIALLFGCCRQDNLGKSQASGVSCYQWTRMKSYSSCPAQLREEKRCGCSLVSKAIEAIS